MPSLSPVERPIGMFDSGFGGLTVARALIDLLPSEDLVYIGDTGRYPYGPKPAAEVRGYAHELAWSLVKDRVVVAASYRATGGARPQGPGDGRTIDLDADDPYAEAADEATMAWTLGHVIVHATASSEEITRSASAA